MTENGKTGMEEENFDLHFVQDDQKDGRKKFKMFQNPVQCSIGSDESGDEHPFVEWPED